MKRNVECKPVASPCEFVSPGAAKPQPISGFLGVQRTCRDGPPGRLYGALSSPEILAKKTRIFGLVVQRAYNFHESAGHRFRRKGTRSGLEASPEPARAQSGLRPGQLRD